MAASNAGVRQLGQRKIDVARRVAKRPQHVLQHNSLRFIIECGHCPKRRVWNRFCSDAIAAVQDFAFRFGEVAAEATPTLKSECRIGELFWIGSVKPSEDRQEFVDSLVVPPKSLASHKISES